MNFFLSHLLKNVLSHMSIHCRKGVVKKVEILVGIHGPGSIKSSYRVRQHVRTSSPGQVYPLLLPAAQIDSFLTDLRGVSTSQLHEISLQSACFQHLGDGILILNIVSSLVLVVVFIMKGFTW